MDPDCQTGASDEPWEATGTALDRMTIGAALRLVVTTWKFFHGGAEKQTCVPCHRQHKVPKGARQKMTFKCRIQLRSSRVNHHSTGWIIFFPHWSQPKDLESICNLGIEKNFLLFQEWQTVVTEPKLYCFQ